MNKIQKLSNMNINSNISNRTKMNNQNMTIMHNKIYVAFKIV